MGRRRFPPAAFYEKSAHGQAKNSKRQLVDSWQYRVIIISMTDSTGSACHQNKGQKPVSAGLSALVELI
jgi:hypothetical protein